MHILHGANDEELTKTPEQILSISHRVLSAIEVIFHEEAGNEDSIKGKSLCFGCLISVLSNTMSVAMHEAGMDHMQKSRMFNDLASDMLDQRDKHALASNPSLAALLAALM